MKGEKEMLKAAVFAAIVIIVAAVTAYVEQFAKLPISNNPVDWANFSNYINPFISLASLPILAILSYLVYYAGTYRDQQEMKFREISERPVIIFKVDPAKGSWKIVNIGKGAAMNIMVAYSNEGVHWLYPVKCYSLEPNGFVNIDWNSDVLHWRAVYGDVFGENVYTATCFNDETEIERGDKLGMRHDYIRLDKTEWQGEML